MREEGIPYDVMENVRKEIEEERGNSLIDMGVLREQQAWSELRNQTVGGEYFPEERIEYIEKPKSHTAHNYGSGI